MCISSNTSKIIGIDILIDMRLWLCQWFTLSDVKRGRVHLALEWLPTVTQPEKLQQVSWTVSRPRLCWQCFDKASWLTWWLFVRCCSTSQRAHTWIRPCRLPLSCLCMWSTHMSFLWVTSQLLRANGDWDLPVSLIFLLTKDNLIILHSSPL